jgi:hypothetical protein
VRPENFYPAQPFLIPLVPLADLAANNPLNPPFVQIKINENWLPYLIGAGKALVANATWASEDDATQRRMLQQSATLLRMLESSIVDPIFTQSGCSLFVTYPDSEPTPQLIFDASSCGSSIDALLKTPNSANPNLIIPPSDGSPLLSAALYGHSNEIVGNDGILSNRILSSLPTFDRWSIYRQTAPMAIAPYDSPHGQYALYAAMFRDGEYVWERIANYDEVVTFIANTSYLSVNGLTGDPQIDAAITIPGLAFEATDTHAVTARLRLPPYIYKVNTADGIYQDEDSVNRIDLSRVSTSSGEITLTPVTPRPLATYYANNPVVSGDFHGPTLRVQGTAHTGDSDPNQELIYIATGTFIDTLSTTVSVGDNAIADAITNRASTETWNSPLEDGSTEVPLNEASIQISLPKYVVDVEANLTFDVPAGFSVTKTDRDPIGHPGLGDKIELTLALPPGGSDPYPCRSWVLPVNLGTSSDYAVELSASTAWIFPHVIPAGYTVEVIEIDGFRRQYGESVTNWIFDRSGHGAPDGAGFRDGEALHWLMPIGENGNSSWLPVYHHAADRLAVDTPSFWGIGAYLDPLVGVDGTWYTCLRITKQGDYDWYFVYDLSDPAVRALFTVQFANGNDPKPWDGSEATSGYSGWLLGLSTRLGGGDSSTLVTYLSMRTRCRVEDPPHFGQFMGFAAMYNNDGPLPALAAPMHIVGDTLTYTNVDFGTQRVMGHWTVQFSCGAAPIPNTKNSQQVWLGSIIIAGNGTPPTKASP